METEMLALSSALLCTTLVRAKGADHQPIIMQQWQKHLQRDSPSLRIGLCDRLMPLCNKDTHCSRPLHEDQIGSPSRGYVDLGNACKAAGSSLGQLRQGYLVQKALLEDGSWLRISLELLNVVWTTLWGIGPREAVGWGACSEGHEAP